MFIFVQLNSSSCSVGGRNGSQSHPGIYSIYDGMCDVKSENSRYVLNRGSYMSDHVILNLLKYTRKRDKMRGFSSILSIFRNKFNKLNTTGARMLDSVYHMQLKFFFNRVNGVKTSTF